MQPSLSYNGFLNCICSEDNKGNALLDLGLAIFH